MKKNMRKVLGKIINVLNVFPLKNVIFYSCFKGEKYGFDQRALLEYADANYGALYKHVWQIPINSVGKPQGIPNHVTCVRKYSLRYLFYLKTAKIIFVNINPPSYIEFRKDQIIINSWHGFPMKTPGKDTCLYDEIQINKSTCFLSDSKLSTEKFIRDICHFSGPVLSCGTPRTDIYLSEEREKKKNLIKKIYGIEGNIVIYGPTFRGVNNSCNAKKNTLNIKEVLEVLKKRFGGEWTLLLRLHPMISDTKNYFVDGAINVSDYPDIRDLLCAADILITDYSSISWDFSLMKRPVFIYADDIEEYKEDRGFILTLHQFPFPISKSNEELMESIIRFNNEYYLNRIAQFHSTVGNYDKGKSCEFVFKYIQNKLEGVMIK